VFGKGGLGEGGVEGAMEGKEGERKERKNINRRLHIERNHFSWAPVAHSL
jgi:hypothetical protein